MQSNAAPLVKTVYDGERGPTYCLNSGNMACSVQDPLKSGACFRSQFLAEHLRMEDVRLYMRDLLQVGGYIPQIAGLLAAHVLKSDALSS